MCYDGIPLSGGNMTVEATEASVKQVELFQYFLRHALVRYDRSQVEWKVGCALLIDKALVASWIDQTATPDAQHIGKTIKVLETIVTHETEY
jgi:hypothetical protein